MAIKEIDLIELLLILWKRKWLILIPTAVLVAAAGALSLLVTRVWELDSIIQSGRIQSRPGTQGPVSEINWVNRTVVLINEKAYHQSLAKKLNLDLGQLPSIAALPASQATLFKLVVRDPDIEKARRATYALFEHLKLELDSRQDAEREKIDGEMKTIESDQERNARNLEILESRLRRLATRKQDIEQDRQRTLERIRVMIEEQSRKLRGQDKAENETKDWQSYSTVIKDLMAYYEALTRAWDDLRAERENFLQLFREAKQQTQVLAASLSESAERKRGLVPIKFITEPQAFLRPPAQRMMLIALATGFILGIVFFTFLALFIDALDRRKTRPS